MVPVKSRKVQLEARHSWKHSDFERDFEGKTGSSFRRKNGLEFSRFSRVFSVFSSFLGRAAPAGSSFLGFHKFSAVFSRFLGILMFSRVFSVF